MFSILRYIMIFAVVTMFPHLIGGGVYGVGASPTYDPAPKIYMTGSSLSGAFASVYPALHASSSTASPPYLDVGSEQFSGSLYLSGAGWVDLGGVGLNCGGQPLNSLTSACSLFGTGAGEIVGDIVFQPGKVQFLPSTRMLSGAVMTYMGEIGVSGIILPLGPVSVSGLASTGVVDHQKQFILVDANKYRSTEFNFAVEAVLDGIGMMPSLGSVNGDQVTVDVSLASRYSIKITDPSGSLTTYSYETFAGVPDQSIQSAFAGNFCHSVFGVDSRCPDGIAMKPTAFSVSPASVVADGIHQYDFTLRLRDRYGNRVTEGHVQAVYEDNTKIQQLDLNDVSSTYMDSVTSSLTGSLNFGDYTTSVLPGFDVTYSIGSFAPTDSSKYTLKLLALNYIKGGLEYDFSNSSDKDAIIFDPMYTVTLARDGDMVVGGEGKFTSTGSKDLSVGTLPSDLHQIFGLSIGGDNLSASYSGLNASAGQVCAKDFYDTGTGSCNWISMSVLGSLPSVIALDSSASSFTGVYTPTVADPELEEVRYRSFVTYSLGEKTIVYPSGSGLLGTSIYDDSLVKVLGQNNVGRQYNGIEEKGIAEKWTQIRAEAARMSRNLTGTVLAGDEYKIFSGSQSINSGSFGASVRSIIVIGGDVTITGDLGLVDRPRAVIALQKDGIGGNIEIDPSVKDISASLFAEGAITSSGDNQLVIQGTVMSYNTMNDAAAGICPRFVATCTSSLAKKYDLAEMRRDYKMLTDQTGHRSTLDIAQIGSYLNIPLIIQYDGRVLSDPPPGFLQ